MAGALLLAACALVLLEVFRELVVVFFEVALVSATASASNVSIFVPSPMVSPRSGASGAPYTLFSVNYRGIV